MTSFVHCPSAGIVKAIRMENFMCHSSLQIELGDRLNFITGQNGSGKSAILTALCVAFGCRAKGTQRASTLKDFIKTGCGSALVVVEMKNEGDDAFKPHIYGNLIIIERRISLSTSSIALKDHQGKKVAGKREELRELVEHFNIDVENPCVIMSQDKSREFLHSGNDKDKFKFFFKATLLQQVSDLLENIDQSLKSGYDVICELEDSVKPIEQELSELQEKIDYMKNVERIAQELQDLKKMLAWSWVYTVDKQLQKQAISIEKLKGRIPTIQSKIDIKQSVIEELVKCSDEKKKQVASMVKNTSEMSRKKDELQEKLSVATKKKLALEEERKQIVKAIQNLKKHAKFLEQQVNEIHEQHVRSTQAEESQMEEKLEKLQNEFDGVNLDFKRLKEEESVLSEKRNQIRSEIRSMDEEIEKCEKEQRDISAYIRQLRQHQTNKVTAFGGEKVINLLRQIERNQYKFKEAPIGPIGSHLTLANGDKWAPAVEHAIGNLLNAFIVTNHKDCLLLRACAREANYSYVKIIIYDFSKPRLHIPDHMLPQTNHPTTLSVIHSANNTVLNVLVDQGAVERQVLVQDYTVGKSVAFDSRDSNLKEVFTLDGYKMFYRASVQTVLPPNKNSRHSRLSSSYDEQIDKCQNGIVTEQEKAEGYRSRKREAQELLRAVDDNISSVKRRCQHSERDLIEKKLALQELRKSYAAEVSAASPSSVNELHEDISKTQEEMQQKEALLDNFDMKYREAEANVNTLKLSFENYCESAKGDVEAFEKAEGDLMQIEEKLHLAEEEKIFYENVMTKKVLEKEIAEEEYQKLGKKRVEDCGKASIICPESEAQALGACSTSTPEELSPKITALENRLKREKPKFTESVEELTALYEENESKILGKRQRNKTFREELDVLQNSLNSRRSKLQRNADLLKRQITREFNNNLINKGITGQINISYEESTLSVQVKMPHDASNSSVRDIRGLSGGERSFSTLCFALALHNMTEAPFRAMDEFDVFMDAVSRKISLETLVEFAIAQGSQWIFITPNDISMVKQDERIKKQQMSAPRS